LETIVVIEDDGQARVRSVVAMADAAGGHWPTTSTAGTVRRTADG
jgi:hypothetical protein